MKVFVIGRDPVVKAGETAFKINDPTNVISRTHCKITQIDNQTFFIEDAGSKNGTIINNILIDQPAQIKADQEIKLSENISFTPNEISLGLDINTGKEISRNAEENEFSKEEAPKKPDQAESYNLNESKPPIQKPEINQINHPLKNFQQPQSPKTPIFPAQPGVYEKIASVFSGTALEKMSTAALLSVFAITMFAAATVYLLTISETISFSGGLSQPQQVSYENLTFNIYGRYLYFSDRAGYTIMKPFDNRTLDTSSMQIMISGRQRRSFRHNSQNESIRDESFISNGINWRVNHYSKYETHPHFNQQSPVKGFEAIGVLGDDRTIYISVFNFYVNSPNKTDLDNFMKTLRSISK